MRISTFFYAIHQGIKNIFRNKMFSLASIATMSACIFMFGLFFSLVSNFSAILHEMEESVAVTVYFEVGITQDRIDEIGEEINKRVEVSECEYVSSDDAWEYVKENYFEGKEELAAAFEGDNPVANSMHYNIYLSDVSMQPVLVNFLEGLDGVREVKQSTQVAETLTEFNKLVSAISVGIVAILLAVSIFLISNTVTVGISVRKEEIGIMKLIGASDFLVRFPFVVEGMIIGLFGALIPLALLYFLYDWIIVYISDKFALVGSMVTFIPTEQIFNGLVPISIALGVGIGLIGSAGTVRKHLKV